MCFWIKNKIGQKMGSFYWKLTNFYLNDDFYKIEIKIYRGLPVGFLLLRYSV